MHSNVNYIWTAGPAPWLERMEKLAEKRGSPKDRVTASAEFRTRKFGRFEMLFFRLKNQLSLPANALIDYGGRALHGSIPINAQ
jgi:hypothetical protein